MTAFTSWKIIGYAAAIFAAGGISGGALGVYHTRTHLFGPQGEQDIAVHMRDMLQKRLELTPDQTAKINPIVDSAAAELHSIRMETSQRVKKVFDDSFAEVSDVLTPEQRTKLEQIQTERREMLKSRWQDGHWHGGGQHDQGAPGDHPGHNGPPRPNPADASPAGTPTQL
jgi:Spy/CpxP family protein refolding chaperone